VDGREGGEGMNSIENTYICLAAPLLLAILCLRKDQRRALVFLLAGMSVCLLSAHISAFLTVALGVDPNAATYTISPVVEEFMKFLPILFYLMVFEPKQKRAINGILLVAVGFATFENVCFLTSYGTGNLLQLLIRGFGAGAMHVLCAAVVAVGLFFMWDRIWLRMVGTLGLLCFTITFHGIFNIFAIQGPTVSLIGSLAPMALIVVYLVFIRRRVAMD
jgi:RsiW-degrading membrane proteinase PrsW (M82 family)